MIHHSSLKVNYQSVVAHEKSQWLSVVGTCSQWWILLNNGKMQILWLTLGGYSSHFVMLMWLDVGWISSSWLMTLFAHATWCHHCTKVSKSALELPWPRTRFWLSFPGTGSLGWLMGKSTWKASLVLVHQSSRNPGTTATAITTRRKYNE